MEAITDIPELNFSVVISNHAFSRMCNRAFNKHDIATCIRFGEVFYKTGIKFYLITRKAINRYNLDNELDGLCVLLSHNNKVITIYKNKEAISQIKRLGKNNKKKYLKYDA